VSKREGTATFSIMALSIMTLDVYSEFH
jgi:hypothetical protein